MLTFDIHVLAKKSDGSVERYEIDHEIVLRDDEDIVPKSNLVGNATFMKLAHEINVQIQDAALLVELVCSSCLKKYVESIEIPFAEREFIIDVPSTQLEIDEDSFTVDTKYWTISLDSMVREEILLHFPAKPVCFEGCKGLCVECFANLNEGPCSHHS